MKENYTILIVEDEPVNLEILTRALERDYFVITAQNGREALDLIRSSKFKISAIILDLIMPVMNGYEFLEEYSKSDDLKKIPVLVSSGDKEVESETRCLELGANDFISKPYNISVIKLRLLNAIERSQFELLEQLKYAVDFDALTGIYNKDKLFREVKNFLLHNSDKQYVYMSYDIDNFKVFNSFFGVEEGDKLIKSMANHLKLLMREIPNSLYSRNTADIFSIIVENDKEIITKIIQECVNFLTEYKPEYRIKPTFGIYIINDRSIGGAIMNDRAKIAARHCKGKFTQYFSYYDEKISEEMGNAQILINRMEKALDEEQFVVYYQPKYDLKSNLPAGAEALCRWIDPENGIISPGAFIPVFEKNGLISKLDYYMWEHVCKQIQNWIKRGIKPLPVSINVSRVNIYNPKLVEIFCELTEKYNVPRELFNIELTESAYTDAPQLINGVMKQFRDNGFITLMDDFGSGYSSLNVLKDMPVDELKIDMKFMSDTDFPERGKCILASIVKMAKWLNMTVVAEGVEKEKQANFLRGIGCEYIQGYYFAKPMPAEEYEKLITTGDADERYIGVQKNDLFAKISRERNINIGEVFINSLHASGIYTYMGTILELITANDAFYNIFGFDNAKNSTIDAFKSIDECWYKVIDDALKRAIRNKGIEKCEYKKTDSKGNQIWIALTIQYLCEIDSKYVGMVSFENITKEKINEAEKCLTNSRTPNVIVIDDSGVSENKLIEALNNNCECFRTYNCQEASDIMTKGNFDIDLIIIDSNNINDVESFLDKRIKNKKLSNIPVIISVSDISENIYNMISEKDISDYIVKPYNNNIVQKRVWNVINASRKNNLCKI